jgi:hypothetical protein
VLIRAPHELPFDGTVVVVCGECPACDKGTDESRIRSLCMTAFRQFKGMGFMDTRYLMVTPDPSLGKMVSTSP